MPYMWHRRVGRKEPMPSLPHQVKAMIDSGFVPAEDLVKTSTGSLCAMVVDRCVSGGELPDKMLKKRRVAGGNRAPIYGEDSVPVFMRPDDWNRLTDEQKAAMKIVPERAKEEAAIASHPPAAKPKVAQRSA